MLLTIIGILLGVVGAAWAFHAWIWPWLRRRNPTKEAVEEVLRETEVPQKLDAVTREVRELKEAFNHWRAVPSDERLRRLLAEETRRENLARAAELAKANKHPEAIQHLKACLGPELSPDNRASVHLLIGNAHLAISQLVQAEAAYRSSLAAARGIGDNNDRKQTTAAALGNLGLVYRQQGELDKALQHYRQALSLFQAIGAKRQAAQAERAIAAVNEAKG